MPISTKNEKAQIYFEQDMGYLHGYTLIEAARSFHEALRHDSAMVMAHVGLSRVYMKIDDKAAARKSAETAKTLSGYWQYYVCQQVIERAIVEVRWGNPYGVWPPRWHTIYISQQ